MTKTIPNQPIKAIEFMGSFPKVSSAPLSKLPEFAFIGRSNVGKSSLINFLCDRRKLAKTSGTPGKTQLINLFEVNGEWILADLPGYGYAKVSKKLRAKWSSMIQKYLLQRDNLFVVFQLIDIRIPPQPSDFSQINWMGENGIPFVIVFTKADKMKDDELAQKKKAFEDILLETWEKLPQSFITSANNRKGREDLMSFITRHVYG